MQAITEKIKDAQKLYDDRCKSVDECLETDIKRLELVAENGKKDFAKDLVDRIIN